MADLLVVDDDVDVADTISYVLEADGHSVRVALDGISGLASVRARIPEAIVLDVDMPRLDGPGMAYQLFLADAHYCKIPIVLVSGVANLRDVAARVGTPYALAKPYGIDDLVRIVARALRERTAPASKLDDPPPKTRSG
jgi:DNA-binding NtrC family response regulator